MILHIKPSYYTQGWEFGFWITSGADDDGKHCYGLNLAFFSGQIHIGLKDL